MKLEREEVSLRKGHNILSIADSFYSIAKKKYLYNITSIDNIPSILQNGILSYDATQRITHASIALSGVQLRRESVIIPGGGRLHSYANLYFCYNNPMLYLRKDMAEQLCIIVLSANVLDIDGCIVSDRNAATNLVRFYSAEEGIKHLDFEKVFARYWTNDDIYKRENHKAIKCAEVLVPNAISPNYFVGAYVVSAEAKSCLVNKGFDHKIVVEPSVFYR